MSELHQNYPVLHESKKMLIYCTFRVVYIMRFLTYHVRFLNPLQPVFQERNGREPIISDVMNTFPLALRNSLKWLKVYKVLVMNIKVWLKCEIDWWSLMISSAFFTFSFFRTKISVCYNSNHEVFLY